MEAFHFLIQEIKLSILAQQTPMTQQGCCLLHQHNSRCFAPTRLSENVNRRHKKRVHAWLCKCCPSSSICPAEWNCPDIHVTPVGYSNRRPWTQALGPNPRKADGSRGEDEDSWSDDEGGAAQQKKPHAAPFLGSSEEEVTSCNLHPEFCRCSGMLS